jgi:hypothetical protein
LALLKIVEITNNTIISARLIMAIIEPIIVNQFLEDGGSFIRPANFLRLRSRLSMSKNRKLMDYQSTNIHYLLKQIIGYDERSLQKVLQERQNLTAN